jgi:signal transduction histidine kinase
LSEAQIFRKLSAIAGGVYLAWWLGVELLLPGSFNPFLSRFVVFCYFLFTAGFSFFSPWTARRLRYLFLGGLWIITLHYYYLFYFNGGAANWIVGDYITVIAIGLALTTFASLVAYSGFVLLLSIFLLYLLPELRTSVFLPGLLTIILQANISLRLRLQTERLVASEKIKADSLNENVRVRDEFISIASHEFKTPLTALRLQAQILERQMKTPRLEFKSFNRQIDRIQALLETLFDVSKISTGQMVLDLSAVDLALIVRETVEVFRGSHPSQEMMAELPEHLMVKADSCRITQVVENLVDNAIKYGNGHIVSICLFSRDQFAVFTIEDHGLGISEENLDKIFFRYERGMTSTHISGFGLGLYIAKQIVDAHGGKISVSSQVGVRTMFTVEIPLVVS